MVLSLACSKLKKIPQVNSTTFNTTQAQLINKKNAPFAIKNLEAFKRKAKFEEEHYAFYPGLESDLLVEANRLMNHAADDFITICKSENISDVAFQTKIEFGINSFKKFNLNTMDKNRVSDYFKELMEIVGLQNDGGHIRNFMNAL